MWGYEEFLEKLNNPDARDEDDGYYDFDFDPEYFDCAAVIFDDPEKRLEYARILEVF